MTGKNDWRRVSKAERCPVCGRADWCLIVGPEGNPSAAICPRTESPKRIGEAGWLHVLRDDGPAWPPWRSTIRRAVKMMEPKAPARDFTRLAADAVAAVRPDALGRLAVALGVSTASLRRLGIGWLGDRRAWGFPMRSAAGAVVGIRLRLPNGRKLSVRGGRLLVCEGPSDTAAALDWGFSAVGRPSCTGGVKRLTELVKRLAPEETVILADADPPGQRGADALAGRLVAYCREVRVITPPPPAKDARAWLRSGATAGDVLAAIEAAPVRRLSVATKLKGRMRCRKTATV